MLQKCALIESAVFVVINRYQSNTGLSGVYLACTDNSKVCRTARAAEQIPASDKHLNLRGLAGSEVRAQPWIPRGGSGRINRLSFMEKPHSVKQSED